MMPAIIAVVVTLIIAVPVTYFVTLNMKKKSDDKTTGNAEDRARQIIDEALKTA
jgi:ribonuclease Y